MALLVWVMAQDWDGQLREALRAGTRFAFSALGRPVELVGTGEPLRLRDGETEFEAPWTSLAPRDKRELALALLKPGDRASAVLAGYYLLTTGERKRAEQLLKEIPDELKPYAGSTVAAPAVARGSSRRPPGVDSAWKPRVFSGAKMRVIRTGVDVGHSVFLEQFKGDVAKATANVHEVIARFNAHWIPELMIEYKVEKIVIRKTPGEDPHHGSTDAGKMWGDTRALFLEKEKLDFGVKMATGLSIALGGGRAMVTWKDWFAFDHEGSHAFGQPHGVGWPYEKGPQNQANVGPYSFVPQLHVFGFAEADAIIANSSNHKDMGPYAKPVAPYARMDLLRVRADADRDRHAFPIDVLGNDHDANNGPLWIKAFDPVGRKGGTLTRGAGGDVLQYKRPGKFGFEMADHFTYTIVDGDGLESKGNILILFEAENLLANAGFDEGIAPWQGKGAALERKEAKLEGGGSFVQQAVALKPKTRYRLSLDVKLPDGQSLTLGVRGGKSEIMRDVAKGKGERDVREFFFTTGENVKAPFVFVQRPDGAGGECLIDNLRLVPVEPE